MGIPGEPPRRRPYHGTSSSPPGESWFDASPRKHTEPPAEPLTESSARPADHRPAGWPDPWPDASSYGEGPARTSGSWAGETGSGSSGRDSALFSPSAEPSATSARSSFSSDPFATGPVGTSASAADPLGVDHLRSDPLGIGAGPSRPEPASSSPAEPRGFFTPFSPSAPSPEPSAHDLGGSTETFTSVLFSTDSPGPASPGAEPRSDRPAGDGAGSPTEIFGRTTDNLHRTGDSFTSATEIFTPSFDSARPSGGDLWTGGRSDGLQQPAGSEPDLWSRPEPSAPTGGPGRPEASEQTERRPSAFERAGDGGGHPYQDTDEPSRERRGRRAEQDTSAGRPADERASRADDPASAKVVEEEPEQRRMWSPYDEGPRSRRPIYISLGALAFLIAGGVGLAYMASAEPDTSVTAEKPVTETNASAPPAVPNHKDGFAASRATDKYPLTLKEIFPRKKITKGGQTYYMTIRRMDKVCKNGATGEKLQKALTAGKCNQLLRASFRDRTGKIIGTVGVANLNTAKSAKKVVDAAAGSKLEDYVKPLPGKDEHTKSLGTGQANAGAWRHGHYAVLLWFQFKDGHEPSKAERKKLTRAAVNITDATVFPALDSRTLTGRRPE